MIFGVGQSELPWGSAAATATAADVTRVCQEIKSLGATSIRMSALWLQLDPNRNHNYQWANLDWAVNAAESAGLDILLIVEPRRSVLPLGVSATTSMATDYGLLCGAIANRYVGRIRWYEIGNEVNNLAFFGAPKTPSKYLNFLRAAFTNITAADPDATVLAGALQAVATGWPTLHPVDWVKAFYDSNPQEWFHGLSMHPYSTDGNFNPLTPTVDNEFAFKNIDAIRAIMDANGDDTKKIFCTEWGYDSMRTLSGLSTTDTELEAEQAANLETHWNILQTYADAGAIYDTTWVFMYRDWEQANKKAQNHFGFVHFDYTKKPAWTFLRNLGAPWPGVVTDFVGVTDSSVFAIQGPAFPKTDPIGVTDTASFVIPSGDVEYVSTGAGDRDTTIGLTTTLTWSHVVSDVSSGALTAGIVVSTDHVKPWDLYNTLSVTSSIDGALTRLGSRHISSSSDKKGSLHIFGLAYTDGTVKQPTVGTHTLTAVVTLNSDGVTSLTAVAGNSTLYQNVAEFGELRSNGNISGNPDITAYSAAGNRPVAVFGGTGDFNTSFNKTVRYHAGSTVDGHGDYILMADAEGANSVNFAASIGFQRYGALALDLIHGAGSVGGETPPPPPPGPTSSGFVYRDQTTGNLMLDGQRYRFAGGNCGSTNFQLSENTNSGQANYGGTVVSGAMWPTHVWLDAIIDSAVHMNMSVIRTFGFQCIDHPLALSPSLNVYNEDAFEPLDYAMSLCRAAGIKVIAPLVDNYDYFMHGRDHWCTRSGVSASAANFYTNATVRANFKAHITRILDHTNQYTGVKYRDDPTILMWETGNELDTGSGAWNPAYSEWTVDIAQHIKITAGAQQLVADGKLSVYADSAGTLDTTALSSPYVDAFTSHPYGNSTSNGPAYYMQQAEIAKSYGKAYFIGESTWNDENASGSTNDWRLPEMLSQTLGTASCAGYLFWELLAPLNNHSDNFPLHYPGDTPDMTCRVKQLGDHAQLMRTNYTAPITIQTSFGRSLTSSTRGVTFNSSEWTPRVNDYVVIFGSSVSVRSQTSLDSAWTNLLGVNTLITSDSHTLGVAGHFVTAAEAAAGTVTYNATGFFSASTDGGAVGTVLRGVDPASPVDAIATLVDSTNAVSPHILAGLSGASLSDNSQVISCIAKDGVNAYVTPPGYGFLNAATANQSVWLQSWNLPTQAGVSVPATNIDVTTSGDEYISITVAFKSAS